jgi:RNA polymerase sigma factor (sigma-70 family)
MDQLIEKHWRSAARIVRAEARRYSVPPSELEEVLQDTLLRMVRYPKALANARDESKFFSTFVGMNARTVLRDRAGYHNGTKSAKASGLQATYAVGLYRPAQDGDSNYMDERILPSMASAEDVYFSSLPSKRQEKLREAIESLPEPQRTAMTHQVYEELSQAQSASLMGVSQGLVSYYRVEGTKALKKILNPKGQDA